MKNKRIFANQEEETQEKNRRADTRYPKMKTETEFSKIKAYEELQRYSPALSSAYTVNNWPVLNLAEANKELNKERDKNSYENILKNIQQWEEKIKIIKMLLLKKIGGQRWLPINRLHK